MYELIWYGAMTVVAGTAARIFYTAHKLEVLTNIRGYAKGMTLVSALGLMYFSGCLIKAALAFARN